MLIPRCFFASGSVRTYSCTTVSGAPAASQNVFWPRTTYVSPTRRADVVSAAASDPASGSVTAMDSRVVRP